MSFTLEKFTSIGRQKLIAMAVATTGLVAVSAFAISLAMSPTYRALSTDLSASQASVVMRALEQGGYAPKLSADGTVISVPEDRIAHARMALAESGVTASGSSGWEIFDEGSNLGMNSFLQRVNKSRAMEGELVRSIQTIDAVESARVHLVLPERETFSQARPIATASVIVKAKAGQQITQKQAQAIRGLVASAVPGLTGESVTVISSTGETILGDEQNEGSHLLSKRAAIEDRIARSVEAMLAARVGAENVRVRVAAEIETTRQVTVAQSYDPDQQVARRTSALREQSSDTNGSNRGVDAANNMPGLELGNEGGSGRESSRSKSLDETNFEIGSTRTEKIVEPGDVKRLTVAVLVNGSMTNGAYEARTAAEMASLTSLAKSAAGIDDQRGDSITVETLPFAENGDMLAADDANSFASEVIASNAGTLLRILGGVIFAVLAWFFFFRPLQRNLRDKDDSLVPLSADASSNQSNDDDAKANAMTGADVAKEFSPTSGDHMPDLRSAEYVAIDAVHGVVKRRMIEELSDIVSADPEKAARTLRSWINQR